MDGWSAISTKEQIMGQKLIQETVNQESTGKLLEFHKDYGNKLWETMGNVGFISGQQESDSLDSLSIRRKL